MSVFGRRPGCAGVLAQEKLSHVCAEVLCDITEHVAGVAALAVFRRLVYPCHLERQSFGNVFCFRVENFGREETLTSIAVGTQSKTLSLFFLVGETMHQIDFVFYAELPSLRYLFRAAMT